MSNKNHAFDGGLKVSSELKRILNQPGFISLRMGGQTARGIYRAGTLHFNPKKLSPFGYICFLGFLDAVKKAVESKKAPPLSNMETPYKWGYATLILFGAERLAPDSDLSKHQHLATLEYLVSQGLPVDVTDIAGWTALSHAATALKAQPQITRALLEAGANPNHQGRYGDVPIFAAIQRDNYEEADLLLKYNADLDIPEADGLTPRLSFAFGGPRTTAVFQRHIQKREGKEEASRMEKQCDHCKKADLPLRICSKCHVARYCSVECQKAAWPAHKKTCQPFGTVTLKPHYEKNTVTILIPNATKQPSAHDSGDMIVQAKSIIIKLQIPLALGSIKHPLLVYTKSRDFVCHVRHQDQPANYDRIVDIVQEKGAGGLKAYFAAELKSKDELVIKVSEVLAAQTF